MGVEDEKGLEMRESLDSGESMLRQGQQEHKFAFMAGQLAKAHA